MAGFFDTLRDLGKAHQQHVQALHTALHTADLQTARDQLADYLQGLSEPGLMGFRASLGMVMAAESHPQVQQALQWVQANVDSLRSGGWRVQTAAHTAPQTPALAAMPEARGAAAGLQTVEQVAEHITPWFQLPLEQLQQRFVSTLQDLDSPGRQRFAQHLDALAQQMQQQAAQLQDQDANAWGSSYEDRMAYMQARLRSGEASASQPAIDQLNNVAQVLTQMAQAARSWQPPAVQAPPPSPEPAAVEQTPNPAPMASALLSQLQEDFAQARQDMDPARAAALQDFMDRLEQHIRQDEARPPLPADASIEDRRADLQHSMESASALRQQVEALREMQRHVRRPSGPDSPAADSRAAQIGPLLDALVDDVGGQRNRPLPAARQTESARLQVLHETLIRARARVRELAASDSDVLHYERDTLRSSVQALRLHHRAGHLMLARPIWPGGAARVEPGSVLIAGASAGVQAQLQQACEQRLLQPRAAAAPGVDPATALWRGMQAASLVVLDLSKAEPQTYYQLGLAYALGTELLLLARRGTQLPFDVAQAVLHYADETDLAAQLPAALDAALYGVQTLGLSALMHPTLQRCEALATRAVGAAHSGVLLQQLQAQVMSPLDFAPALEQFLAQLGNSRLMLLHPRWPAHYPDAMAGATSDASNPQPRRCFVVMPFAHSLADTQAQYRAIASELSAAGVQVVRGDEALGQDIVASIWEETARASHVLVDLTGYNPNVCLELGMADAMGRDTLLIGRAGSELQRFAAIDKRRIHGYGSDAASQAAVREQVRAFVLRAPTLL